MTLVDKSALVAWLEDDPRLPADHPALAEAWTISTLSLAELASLEARQRLPAGASAAVRDVGGAEAPTADDCMRAGALHGKLRGRGSKASIADCIMLEQARRRGEAYLTLDHDLAALDGVVVP